MSGYPLQQGQTLDQVAKVIPQQERGPFEITFEIMFDDAAPLREVKSSGTGRDRGRCIAAGVSHPSEHVLLVCNPFDARAGLQDSPSGRPVSRRLDGYRRLWWPAASAVLPTIVVPR